jgi:hypothetical protein
MPGDLSVALPVRVLAGDPRVILRRLDLAKLGTGTMDPDGPLHLAVAVIEHLVLWRWGTVGATLGPGAAWRGLHRYSMQ